MEMVAMLEGRLASQSEAWKLEIVDLKGKLQEAEKRASRVVKEYLASNYGQHDMAEYEFGPYGQGFKDCRARV